MIGYYKNTGENPLQKGLLKIKNRYETALTQRVGIEDGSSGYCAPGFTSYSCKVGLIKTLVDRGYKINNIWLGFHDDITKLMDILKKNLFPAQLVPKVLNHIITGTQSNHCPTSPMFNKYQNGCQKWPEKLLILGMSGTQYVAMVKKTVKLVLWNTFTRILLQTIKHL